MTNKPKDSWDKAQIVLIPLAVAVTGGWIALTQKHSENQVRYVELATSIIRSEPTDSTRALREWAVEVLSSQSPVPISVAAQTEMKNKRIAFITRPYGYCPDGTAYYAASDVKLCPAGGRIAATEDNVPGNAHAGKGVK